MLVSRASKPTVSAIDCLEVRNINELSSNLYLLNFLLLLLDYVMQGSSVYKNEVSHSASRENLPPSCCIFGSLVLF